VSKTNNCQAVDSKSVIDCTNHASFYMLVDLRAINMPAFSFLIVKAGNAL